MDPSMAAHRIPQNSRLLSLPSEIIELIVVNLAVAGHTESVAAIAQSCHAMRNLVYGATDQHLWREIYLSIFDDPRLADEADRECYHSEERPSSMLEHYDWGAECRQRIWTANFIRRSTSPSALQSLVQQTPSRSMSLQSMTQHLNALETLLSVVKTAAPFPMSLVFCLEEGSRSISGFSTSAIFPPPPTNRRASLAGSTLRGNETSKSSYAFSGSRNIRWFEDVLGRGYPPSLTSRLTGLDLSGGTQAVWSTQIESRMMRALGRLIAYTGFKPVPIETDTDETSTGPNGDTNPAAETDNNAPELIVLGGIEVGDNGALLETLTGGEHVHVGDTRSSRNASTGTDSPSVLDMSPASQSIRARCLARMRVYNMQYLARERHWGPFLLTQSSDADVLMRPSRMGNVLHPIMAMIADHAAGHPGHDEDDEDEDVEYESIGDDEQDDDQARHSSDEEEEQTGPTTPTPAQLHADWAYLGACRVVVEANLRESVGPSELAGLVWLDGLRRGSASRDLTIMAETGCVSGLSVGKGKGKEKAIDGWDWAAVSGLWRRCVCWMDYRDLILHNVQFDAMFNEAGLFEELPNFTARFNDPGLQEAVRIVPMRLRIVSYSPCEVPGYAHRPNIHVEGETTGPAGTNASRKLRGTVGMIADGCIRWQLYSSPGDGDADEWVTEGIQLGEVTSAMGVIGMWTGAQHERMDPLGPFWAWKVD
ncbi:hypothetical protein K474DRAFT_1664918 [Panus rudis PR-1116 ss-1]|nr:hypothetical protein K474DRAFT_1664918 [Panus rudis PR-1116 ss-1]